MTEAQDRLLRIAHKRTQAPRSCLSDEIRPRLGEIRLDRWVVPEDMSLGYYTPYWEELREEERRALNHWIYALTYSRIRNGERYVLRTNAAISAFLRPHAPAVADLLDRESAEEVDHVAAFDLARGRVCEVIGLGDWRWPTKRGNGVISSPAAIRGLLASFGSDYVVAYFLGRGLANHMGKGFEAPIARDAEGCAATRELSLQHTLDESHHMAVSGLMAAAAPDLLPRAGRRGPLYRRLFRGLQQGIVRYTFGQAIYKSHERRLSHAALARLPALAGRSPAFRRELVEAHFDSTSGLERSRNKVMPRPNRRLLEGAALAAEDRQLWEEELVAGQGNLRFFG